MRIYRLTCATNRLAGSIIAKIIYGYKPQGNGDRMIKAVDRAMEDFAVILTPGAYMADFFPIRKSYVAPQAEGTADHVDSY